MSEVTPLYQGGRSQVKSTMNCNLGYECIEMLCYTQVRLQKSSLESPAILLLNLTGDWWQGQLESQYLEGTVCT